MRTVFASLKNLADAAPATVLGTSVWMQVDQDTIDGFAAVTGDDQWIHVDRARAAAGPFGAPIAHGYLVLALLGRLTSQTYGVEGVGMAINYGLDRVRFLEPVPAGGRVRASAVVRGVAHQNDGVKLSLTATLHLEGAPRPACVADLLALLLP